MATVTQPKKFNHEETQQRVKHPLQLMRKYIRGYIILEGVALTVLCATLLFWLGLAFDYGLMMFDFESIGVHGIDWVLSLNEIDTTTIASTGVRIIVLTVIVVGLLGLGVMKVAVRWIREFNDRALALVLERRFPKELGDRLITAVELHNPKLAQKYGYSQAMVEKTIMDAVDVLKKLPVSSVFNWKRLVGLWFMVGMSTIGLFVFSMVVVCGGWVVVEMQRDEENEPNSALLSPWGFSWRFYDVAAIWTERNVLMMNTYWPRRAYVEFESFQPSKNDADNMRVAANPAERPELRVRAFQWVIADRSAPRGWRALKWQDLEKHNLVDQALLNRVNKIPEDFADWRLDTDELEPNLVEALWNDKATYRKSGEVREHFQTAAVQAKIEERKAKETLRQWQDWREWTVDKLRLQTKDTQVRVPMRDEINYNDVEAIFDALDELADSPWWSRTVRKLQLPQFVEVRFQSDEASSSPFFEKLEGNKYHVQLTELPISTRFRFRARGGNYFTPPKTLSMIAAPTPARITTDTEEPAYLYHRLPYQSSIIDDPGAANKKKEIILDNQMGLRDKRHKIKGTVRPATGALNTIDVMLGSKVAIHVEIDTSPVVWGDLSVSKITPVLREQAKLPAGEGVLVSAITEKSPLAEKGLKVGDLLVRMDGNTVVPSNLEKFAELVKEPNVARSVDFQVKREEEVAVRGGAFGQVEKKFKDDTITAAAMPAEVKYNPRKLHAAKGVFTKNAPVPDPGAEGFPVAGKTIVHADLLGFTLQMDAILRNHHFMVEFFDEDGIRGERYFKVTRSLDADPSVGNLSVFGYQPRVPRFKAAPAEKKEKDKDGKDKDKEPTESREQIELTKAYLITPDAQIPLECKVSDDYGLVRVGYHYKYRKVDFEMIANLSGGKRPPAIQIDQATNLRHMRLIASNFQLWPGNPIAWHAAPNFIGMNAYEIQRDIYIAQGYREGLVPSPAFDDDLRRKLNDGDMTNTPVLSGPAKARPWEFDFRNDGYFDLQRHLWELKNRDPEKGQMHYHLQIAVQATDNNVETGAPYFLEIDKIGPDGKKLKETIELRGNTRKNGNGYLNFVIITENELLAQIALEEEILFDKLQAAKDKVDAGMVSLLEQQAKMSAADGKPDMEAIVTRMNLIRTALGMAGNNLRDADQAYDNILKEMNFNRVKNKRIEKIEDNIISRLKQIVQAPDPRVPGSGSYTNADEAFQKVHERVEADLNNKRAPDAAANVADMKEAYTQMNRLSNDIQKLLDAMTEGMVDSQLIAILASIEQEQRKISNFLKGLYDDELNDTIKKLQGDIDPKKPEKKSSQMQIDSVNQTLPLALAPADVVSPRVERMVELTRGPALARFVPRDGPARHLAHAGNSAA